MDGLLLGMRRLIRRQPLIQKFAQQNNPVYRWLLFRYIGAKDRLNGKSVHLPSPELRYRVGASPIAEEFLAVGKTCANDIQSALEKVGRQLSSFDRILDFGCGCGRTLMHLDSLAPDAQIHGADIDANAIEWCRENLNFAEFKLSKELPPIDYEADAFDLVYAISVFTHLDEDYQFRWLEELRRIAKPGGLLLLTVHAAPSNGEQFVFERSYERGLFPSWYQNSRHSKQYVYENFGKYFKVLDYFPRGMNGHQDVVVLQKQDVTSNKT